MRLAPDTHIEWVDDEAVVLDQESGQLHYLNRSAALVLAMILEHGHEEGIKKVIEMHGAQEQVHEDVDAVLNELVDKKVLIPD